MLKRYIIPMVSFIGGTVWLLIKKLNRRQSFPRGFPIGSIDRTTDSVIFHWKDPRSRHLVYKGGKLIYDGDGAKFTDTRLNPGTNYVYTMKVSVDRKSKPLYLKVQTSTAMESNKTENVLDQVYFTTVLSHSFILLNWEPIEGVKEYTVYRNGAKVATVADTFFVDRKIRLKEKADYLIRAERPLTQSDEGLNEGKFVAAGFVGLFKKGNREKDEVMERFHFKKMIDPLEDLLKEEPEEDRPKDWILLYRTFLKKKWIKNPNPASPYRYFKGDGRYFDPESDRYRTSARVTVANEDVQLESDIGKTKGYGRFRNLKKEETASAEGIQLENLQVTDGKVSFLVSHSVKNPLVTSPAVDYNVRVNLYQNGFFDISGVHDQSPHHEVYLKQSSRRSWDIIHLAENEGLEWMSDTMASLYWRVSNFK
ncbi:DUF3238 domain-containing protein [Siminovitchia sediminis]|uniref:DUF3238 domain-containing protein n=1 Tax=Siminovitchia sediminis TaxID=1274353 RepID=A0ABW4KF91_9BACI